MRPVERLKSVPASDAVPVAPVPAPRDEPRVIRIFLRFLRLAFTLAVLLPFIITACTWMLGTRGGAPAFWVPLLSLALLGTIAARGLGAKLTSALQSPLERLGEAQAKFVAELPEHRVPLAIAGSAGLSLFLELAVIRWHGTEWEIFALYKNFSLLACFLGLGLGYAIARARPIPAVRSARRLG